MQKRSQEVQVKAAGKEPTVFEHQLEQYKIDLKSAIEDGHKEKIKEITRYMRNLEQIIKRVKNR